MDGSGTAAGADDNALAVARAVLARAPVFDGHNDLPWVIRIDKAARGDPIAYGLNQVHEKADTDIPRLREGMVGAQFWAAFQPTGAPHPARTALEQIDLIRRIEAAHPGVFLPARRAADYARARAAGKIASFIAVEGGVGLENSLSPLRIWHAAGVRLMTLCHNESLDWVDSATDAPRNGGLNAFGRAVIGELNRLGIVIDLAHVSHDGMRRALDATEAPVALSHANAFSLCDHPRNAPDDVLRRLRDNGGLVMATFVPGFISQRLRDWLRRGRAAYAKAPPAADPTAPFADPEAGQGQAPRATLEEVADHIERLASTAGVDHVGIGSDYFGGAAPQGLENVSRFPHLFAELVRRGFSEGDLMKMSSANVLRVMRRVEAVGRRLARTRPPAHGRIEDYPGA
ncbi:membrane dipeptidase [Roseiarcus fermentans]|uniref:Membrane dipeptidase n=1 Tax=Roseiarcus fermentans TaxID=1473586 RepID=A0A366FUB6_9HYPH|nr:dipeptidase [Roseiarcus fermentans]RBP18262.1 membrane dipeptidase [Roseiarcus fermentans]